MKPQIILLALAAADRALYQAKHLGMGCVCSIADAHDVPMPRW
jgi:hypothetical protein